MVQMIYGFAVSQIVRAFAEYSIADELALTPATANEIAARCSTNSDGMFRLLRAGIPLGLVTVDAEMRFQSTPLLRMLERNRPSSPVGPERDVGVTRDLIPLGQPRRRRAYWREADRSHARKGPVAAIRTIARRKQGVRAGDGRDFGRSRAGIGPRD
jgi:hypothetical protein